MRIVALDYGIQPSANREDVKVGTRRWYQYRRIWSLWHSEIDLIEKAYLSAIIDNIDLLLVIEVDCWFCDALATMRNSNQVLVCPPDTPVVSQTQKRGSLVWRCNECRDNGKTITLDGMELSFFDQQNDRIVTLSSYGKEMLRQRDREFGYA